MVPPSTVGLEVLALGTGFPMRSPRCLTTMLEVIAEALIMLIITTITVTDDTILLTVTINMELAILRMWRTPLSKEQPRVDQFLPNQKNLQTQGLRTLHQRKISDMVSKLTKICFRGPKGRESKVPGVTTSFGQEFSKISRKAKKFVKVCLHSS